MTTTELRPLTLGELLDRTFSYYRGHFWLFVGIMAIPHVFLMALNLLVQAFQHANFTPPTAQDPAATMRQMSAMVAASASGMIAILVFHFVFYTVALGATTYALSEVHPGRTTSIRGRLRKIAGQNRAALRLDGADHAHTSWNLHTALRECSCAGLHGWTVSS